MFERNLGGVVLSVLVSLLVLGAAVCVAPKLASADELNCPDGASLVYSHPVLDGVEQVGRIDVFATLDRHMCAAAFRMGSAAQVLAKVTIWIRSSTGETAGRTETAGLYSGVAVVISQGCVDASTRIDLTTKSLVDGVSDVACGAAPPPTTPPPAVAPKPVAQTSSTTAGGNPHGTTICQLSPGDWCKLAKCESSDRNVAAANGHYGFLQFSPATWRDVGGSGLPTQATAAEQLARAKILYSRRGWQPWTCAKTVGLR